MIQGERGQPVENSTESEGLVTPDLTSGAYLFRGDDHYRGGPVGKALGVEADGADIQDDDGNEITNQPRRLG